MGVLPPESIMARIDLYESIRAGITGIKTRRARRAIRSPMADSTIIILITRKTRLLIRRKILRINTGGPSKRAPHQPYKWRDEVLFSSYCAVKMFI
ncbi:hypothetical protein D3C74_466700 [compost metagenome]